MGSRSGINYLSEAGNSRTLPMFVERARILGLRMETRVTRVSYSLSLHQQPITPPAIEASDADSGHLVLSLLAFAASPPRTCMLGRGLTAPSHFCCVLGESTCRCPFGEKVSTATDTEA